MRCDICDMEVANTEELKAHKERDHTPEEIEEKEREASEAMKRE